MGLFSLASLANPHGILLAAGIGAATGAITAGPATYYVTHAVMKGHMDDLIIADQKAAIAAKDLAVEKQRNADLLDRDRAVKEGMAQQHLEDLKNNIPREVTHYVNNKVPCVSFGFVRMLDAHAIGVDPESLPLASGQSNDTCAPIDNTTLAASIASNYTTANQNAEQLNALIDNVLTLKQQQEATPTKKPPWYDRIFNF